MKIAFFVYEYPPAVVGGLGTYAQYITRELVRQGHDVTVLAMNKGDLKTREVLQGVEVHRSIGVDATNVFPSLVLEELRYWGSFFNDIFVYNILSASKFINQLINREEMRFDVVAVHDWLSAIAGLVVDNQTNLPVVFHVHSTEWGRRADGGSPTVLHLEWEMQLKADRVLTVSQAMRDDLVRHNWQGSKISVVWNGVDPQVYDPDRVSREEVEELRQGYGIAPDEIMLLFVGRLTWVKGVRNLVQALPEVLRDYPKVKLVILGKGEEQRDISELASRLGISDRVITRYEFVSEAERITHYAASDLCVFPSVYEPFGIVSLEAMSLGKPLIVGANGVVGFREQVVPSGVDQNGLHVDGNSPMDIAWGIKTALKDSELLRVWGIKGRERVQKLFTWEQVAKQTANLYQEVSEKKRSGNP